MKIGKILLHIKLLYGASNMIQEMLKIDGLSVEWNNKIKNKDKNRKKSLSRLLKI